jgi:hypothetical protein
LGLKKPSVTGIFPEDKYEAATISVDYIFFQIFKINPFSVLLNQN